MSWKQFFKDTAFYYTVYNVHKINQGVQDLNDSVKEFADQSHRDIQNLTQVIQDNLSAITLELTLHTKLFRQILEVLKNKIKAEAEELKQFGLYALKNGWIEDAEKDFLESIKINRYDYQVYYLLSKVASQKQNFDEQGEYLKKAYEYAGEDAAFKEYVLLDIAVLYLQMGEIEIVKSIIDNIKLRGEQTFVTCMMRIILDIKIKNINDETFINIEKAIDLYESEEPVRIIQAIKALSTLLSTEEQVKVENILNKKKLTICKKFGLNTLTRVENLNKLLTYILKNDNFIKGIVPAIVIQKVFPYYHKLTEIIFKLDLTKNKLQDITINDYEKLSIMPLYLEQIENRIINHYRNLLAQKQEDNFLAKPFDQTLPPELNFNLGSNDKILVQVKLDTGEFLTLSYFKFLIIQDKNSVLTYDLLEDFTNIENDILEKKEFSIDTNQLEKVIDNFLNKERDRNIGTSEKIKFFLRDTQTGKILTINDCSQYSTQFGSRQGFANLFNLLMARTLYNIKYLLMLKMFNISSIQLENILNFYLDIKIEDDNVEFIDDNVEFLN